jgi:hypothetical protein
MCDPVESVPAGALLALSSSALLVGTLSFGKCESRLLWPCPGKQCLGYDDLGLYACMSAHTGICTYPSTTPFQWERDSDFMVAVLLMNVPMSTHRGRDIPAFLT